METGKHDWYIIELSHNGEQKAEEGTLSATIIKDLTGKGYPNHPVFVPSITYTKAGRTSTIHLMEGYVFVRAGLSIPTLQFLEGRGYVTKILTRDMTKGRLKEYSIVADSYIKDLQIKLRSLATTNFESGQKVTILEGPYTNLEGEILDFEDDKVYLRLVLRSLTVITAIPKIFIDPSRKEA